MGMCGIDGLRHPGRRGGLNDLAQPCIAFRQPHGDGLGALGKKYERGGIDLGSPCS